MINKSQLNDYPGCSTTRADLPLKKVYFDLISPKIISIEGHYYGEILTDEKIQNLVLIQLSVPA